MLKLIKRKVMFLQDYFRFVFRYFGNLAWAFPVGIFFLCIIVFAKLALKVLLDILKFKHLGLLFSPVSLPYSAIAPTMKNSEIFWWSK